MILLLFIFTGVPTHFAIEKGGGPFAIKKTTLEDNLWYKKRSLKDHLQQSYLKKS